MCDKNSGHVLANSAIYQGSQTTLKLAAVALKFENPALEPLPETIRFREAVQTHPLNMDARARMRQTLQTQILRLLKFLFRCYLQFVKQFLLFFHSRNSLVQRIK